MKANRKFVKSRIVPCGIKEVMAEYHLSAATGEDFTRAKWGSEASMLNRFQLAFQLIDWPRITTWLDLGCGTGRAFTEAEKAEHRFFRLTGVDISPAMIEIAQARQLSSKVEWLSGELDVLNIPTGSFDLLTVIGVLQQCGTRPEAFLRSAVAKLRPRGIFFLTTKNLNWREFTNGNLQPEAEHSWFDFQEVANELIGLGIRIVNSGGFLPKENQITVINESHTFFILGKRDYTK